jgi:hypothetical protein
MLSELRDTVIERIEIGRPQVHYQGKTAVITGSGIL